MPEKDQLSKAYDPASTEDRIYKMWEESGAFQPVEDAIKESFSIIMPPPNANGDLHLGHAMYVIQDIMTRWHRMQGQPTLWLPGTDHAGIETQVVFERKLEKEGKSRFDLGPEKFYEEVMKFTRANQGNILDQMRSMGFSADWSKLKFTLDDDIIDIVYDTFIELDRDGMVYRGNRVSNWCPRCQTSFADIEIKHIEEEGHMYTLDYGSVRIGTTRPETIFADTAVAVNPQDARYKDLIGKKATVPLLGKEVPIIADDHVDPKVGTGALKVTPAHDFNDFEIGMRHGLPSPSVINKEGRMIDVPKELEGMFTFEAREKVVQMLEASGVLLHKEPIMHSVAHCERCGTVIEPLPTDQWYVKVDSLKQRAKEAIESGKVRIVPERFTKQCIDWLDQMYDWNVSRQIWWGIRMPVFYPLKPLKGKNDYLIAKTEEEAKKYYGEGNYRAETDTFDTWFSSSQWPHATLETNGVLDRFYPTSVMETGRDILYKWVARMIMLGLYKMDEVPFKTVYLHGLVRDQKGQKMSKSKGNVINPLEMTSRYGTDALRVALTIGVTPGNDGSLSQEKVEGYKNFINKLWNASRFVLMQCEKAGLEPKQVPWVLHTQDAFSVQGELSLADRAILSGLQTLTDAVTQDLEAYNFSEAGERIYTFTWSSFCDWHLELSKGEANPRVLVHALRTILQLLHPFCPFITEELWAKVSPQDSGMLVKASWPVVHEELRDRGAEKQLQTLIDVITTIRKLRTDSGIEPAKEAEVLLISPEHTDLLRAQALHICRLGRVRQLDFISKLPEGKQVSSAFLSEAEVHLSLEGLVDTEKETKAAADELKNLQNFAKTIEAKLSNASFVDRAPAAVVDAEKVKLEDAKAKIAKLEERLKMLKGMK
jgi:valyl-tRNA synthetase